MQTVRISGIDETTKEAVNLKCKDGKLQVDTELSAVIDPTGLATEATLAGTHTLLKYVTSADMTTAADITAAPTSGQKMVADSILVSAAVDMEFTIQEETSATVLASVFVPAYGIALISLVGGVKAAVADKKLQGKASVAGNVRITTKYHSEA